VFAIPVAGGAPRRLGPGNGVVSSPRGQRVVWVSRGQIWSVDLAGTDKPAQLVNARGRASSLTWSPDGTMIAFSSNRGTHSYIAVFTPASRELRYVDPSLDRDGSAAWSADGGSIAWIRQAAAPRPRMFSPRRTADEPWSIRVANVKSGDARQVWKAEAGYGSAFQGVVAEQQLLWGAGDRLVFPWEKDGWLHLYGVPARGGAATLLTPGDGEVEYVSLAPDRIVVAIMNMPAVGGLGYHTQTDGAQLSYRAARFVNSEIYVMKRDQCRRPQPFCIGFAKISHPVVPGAT